MIPDYPNNADGDALRRVAADGSDMSKPMVIDFSVAIPDETSGNHVASATRSAGYDSYVSQDKDSGEWTCYCTKSMIATYVSVVSVQDELDKISHPFGGITDGWGTFGNVDTQVGV